MTKCLGSVRRGTRPIRGPTQVGQDEMLHGRVPCRHAGQRRGQMTMTFQLRARRPQVRGLTKEQVGTLRGRHQIVAVTSIARKND